MQRKWISLIVLAAVMSPAFALTPGGKSAPKMTDLLLHKSSPLVSFRILFNTGSASDPAGKEGVAALTAAMLSDGGSRTMTYEQIVQAMYPMATSFSSSVDKEMTAFVGQTHVDNLQQYFQIISGMMLDPGWRQEDFDRLKEDAINYLKVNLRGNNDEELGKEALYNFIYEGGPYGHENTGTVKSLQNMTLDDLKSFYRTNYTQANLVFGLAGGYPADFAARAEQEFAGRLPAGTHSSLSLPAPKKIDGLEMTIIQKDARATAISFGFPVSITRSDPDWPALLLVQSYFGQHRSSNSYLYQRLRQIRGLNYGDYAYIEYFPSGMFQFKPSPNLARHQQIFQVWIRPVEPQNGLFALRIALFELNKLVRNGMSQADFEATRLFLSKFINVLTNTQDTELGYALDSRFYGIPGFNDYVRSGLGRLTVDDVNRVIRKYLNGDNVRIVVVAKDAEAFRKAAVENAPSPITYAGPMPKEILDEDKVIESYKLNLNPNKAHIVPVDSAFQQ
jgi:zinc protease